MQVVLDTHITSDLCTATHMATRDAGNMALNDFLEAQGLLNYANKFEEVGARKMDDLVDLDLDILTGDIGMSKLEGKRFLRKLGEIFGKVSSLQQQL